MNSDTHFRDINILLRSLDALGSFSSSLEGQKIGNLLLFFREIMYPVNPENLFLINDPQMIFELLERIVSF